MKAVNISFEGAEAQKIACESGMKFVFDASVGEAEFTRDGNDLVISKGGVAIVLTSFYDVYNKEEQPSFEIDGVDIASADFFQAMNATDLQPAAGPGGQSAASAAAGGGRYSAYSDMALLDGINKLGPLDIGFNGEPPIHEYLASAGRRRGYDEERPADIEVDVDEAALDGGNQYDKMGSSAVPIAVKGYTIVNGGEGRYGHVVFDEATGSWLYELTKPFTDETTGQDGRNTVRGADEVVITVRDQNGNEFQVTVHVNITDDVPLAKPDYEELTEGVDTAVSGDVTCNDTPGADGLTDKVDWNGLADGSAYELGPDGTVTRTDTGQKVGTLTLNEDGTYRFELDPGYDVEPGSQPPLVVNYTITDKDGDTSSSFLQIDINGTDPVKPEPVYVEVYEAALPDGSAYPDISSGKAVVAVKGYTIVDGGKGNYGHVAYDEASGTWQYVLTKTYTDSTTVQDGRNLVRDGDDVVITVQDADGNPFPVTVHVGIWDDVPSIDATAPVVTEGGTGTGTISRLYGADVPEGSTVAVANGTLLKTGDHAGWYEMEHGWVKVAEDGKTYTYEAKPDTAGEKETITFTITDADGDVATTNVDVFTVKDLLVDEADLVRNDGGNAVEFQHWNAEEMLGKGFTIVSAKLDPSGAKAGSIALDKDGTGLTYTLEHRTDGKIQKEYAERGESVRAEDTTQQETIHLIVKDAKGNHFDVDVHVKVIDDVPTFTSFTHSDNVLLSNNIDVNGSFSVSYGADGEARSNALSVAINGGKLKDLNFDDLGQATVITELGKLTVTRQDDASGVYSYKFVNDTVKVDETTLTVSVPKGAYNVSFVSTDADGDSAVKDVFVNVEGKPVYSVAVLYDLGDNMSSKYKVSINNALENKIDVNIQNILNQVESILDEHGDKFVLDLSIIPFDFRAYTPETNGYFWDFGNKGVFRNFTKDQMPLLKAQLEEMAILHDAGSNNTKQWALGRGIEISDDVVFTGTFTADGDQEISTSNYFNSNNFQSAFDAASRFFEKQSSGNEHNQVIVTGGIWANYSNELYSYSFKNIYSFGTKTFNARAIFADFDVIKKHIEQEEDGIYCDSIYRYRMSENGIQYTKLQDESFDNYLTMRAEDKTIRLQTVELDVTDCRNSTNTFSIGGYKYYLEVGKDKNGNDILNNIKGCVDTETSFSSGPCSQIKDSTIPLDFGYLKEQIESSSNNSYSDSLYTYEIHGDNIQFRFTNDNTSKVMTLLPTDKYFNSSFSRLHIYDGMEFNIAGYEYKVVEHKLSINLYYRKLGEEKYQRTDEAVFGDKIEILSWIGAGFNVMNSNDKTGAIQIWQKAAEALDLLREHSDKISFTGLYDNDNGHFKGLDNFIYYLNYHSQINALENSENVIEQLIRLGDPHEIGAKAGIDEKMLDFNGVLRIGDDKNDRMSLSVHHMEAVENILRTSQDNANDSFIIGTKNSENLQGNIEEDFIFGGDGNDIIQGNAGDDSLYGERGNDEIHGGKDTDILDGGKGNDKLFGDEGNDFLFGREGNDYLNGGNGESDGKDYIYGGEGNDIIQFDPNDVIDGNEGIDFLLIGNKVDDADLSKILQTTNVSNIEVAISGTDATSLTDMKAMADVGIATDGQKLYLDKNQWNQNEDGTYGRENSDLSLATLNTTVEEVSDSDELQAIAAQQIAHSLS